MLPPDDTGLGPQGEAEWQRLRRQVEWAEGFWLCFIFAPSPRSTGVLRRRTERLLRGQTRRLSWYEPSQPDELPAALSSLLAPEARDAGGHWIEALHLDSGEQPEGPWHKAWVELAVLMNERRDALRRHLRGGLVLVAPARMKRHFRDMASDLWSVRALVLELAPVAEPAGSRRLPDVEHSSLSTSRMEQSGSIPDADFALTELRRLQHKYTGSAKALASMLMRAVDGLLASGRVVEALEAARQTWELVHTRAQEEPQNSALILHALARSEEAHGDLAAASDHLEQAVSLTSGQTDRQRLFLLEDMARLAYVRKDWHEANRAYEEALTICRQRLQTLGDTPEALRDLSVSLNRVGDIRRAQGELAAASESYEESLSLRRLLRQSLGDTPEALRDLSVSLNHVGDIRRARGELAAASEACEEALSLSRLLRQLLGDTLETLHDLSVSLDHMGDVRRARGELAAASEAYEESLSLRRLLRQSLGDTPEALRDLSVSLNRVGDVRLARGELAAAAEAYEKSLSLSRLLRQSLGDIPEALRDLSISLNHVGDVRRAWGELAAASKAYEESLSLIRQVRERLGDTPQVRQDLDVCLVKSAAIRQALGDEQGAQSARAEADTLRSPED